MDNYQVAIIGGGPGGYVTAIRLNQYEINTVVFEKENLGGVCLNWGCIPTKSMLKSAELMREIKNSTSFGVNVEKTKLQYSQILQRKNQVVQRLVSGVEFIFKKRKIPLFYEKVNSIKRNNSDYILETDNRQISAKYVIIATGSVPKQLPNIKIDGRYILSSRDILTLEKLPQKLAIIGGGTIGCEFASIFSEFGSKVEIIEFLPKLINTEDREISLRLAAAMKKKGISIHLNTQVKDYKISENEILLECLNNKQIKVDKVLLSVGRMPYCDIYFTQYKPKMVKGAISIDNKLQTNIPNIYALGDVTGKMLLAHAASKQGLLTAEIIKNKEKHLETNIPSIIYENIPRCTFTHPEIGSIGLTESQAKEAYKDIIVSKFPFSANGKAICIGETFGFVKAIAERSTHKILGMHIIGPHAAELIAEAGIMISSGMTSKDAADFVYAHPTLSETVAEAIEKLEDLSIHSL